MSTRNISWGGKDGQCIGLTTLPPSCANCLEIWECQPPGTLWACNRYALGLLYLYTMGNPEEHDLMSTQYESLKILLQVPLFLYGKIQGYRKRWTGFETAIT